MSSLLQNRAFYGGNVNRRSEPKFLFVACFDPHGIGTVGEHIGSWQSFTRFDFHLVNLWPPAGGALAIPDTVDLSSYDGIILHNTTAYFPANLLNLDSRLRVKFRDYDGVKVLVKQDEHYHSAKWAEFIRSNDFNVLVTCVPPAELDKVYPRSIVGDIPVLHALTGFVSPFLQSLESSSYGSRTIDVGYRGSVQPLAFGRLGFEKRKIGFDVTKAMSRSDWQIDVSSRWEDRITGDNWLEFLTSSKVTLGVESGSNLFDFDGAVEQWCQGYENQNQNTGRDSEEFYLRAHELFLHEYEGNVDYAQISPRHFEAAAARSVQLLYEGSYSGIFVPDRHYIPLKRDLSNLKEALEVTGDPSRAKQLTEAAFDEIIMNENFTYARFVSGVDAVLEAEIQKRASRRSAKEGEAPAPCVNEGRRRALMLMPHEPTADPRVDWFCTGLTNRDFDVVEIGIKNEAQDYPIIEELGRGRTRVRVGRASHANDGVSSPVQFGGGGVYFPEHMVLMMAVYSKMDLVTLAERLGAYGAVEGIERFTWYCSYFYDINSSLLRAARSTGAYDVVIAADLDVLPAALMLARESNAVCVYDSHEYWKGNFFDSPWAFEFWASIEKKLVELSDIRCTVSPPLAKQLQLEYGKPFGSVPNCELIAAEPVTDKQFVDCSNLNANSVIFLFQGTFHPGRPIGKLIDTWKDTDENAILWLRGPNWSHRDELIQLAESTGLLGTRIFFPDAVAEKDLVSAAAEADVGIIPYDPSVHFGYKFACPNKLSQYLAAGLAILTTDLEYVRGIVTENNLGRVFDLRDMTSLVHEVNTLTRDRSSLKEQGRASREYFLAKFNWETVSSVVYNQITAALHKRGDKDRPDRLALRFDQILARELQSAARQHEAVQPDQGDPVEPDQGETVEPEKLQRAEDGTVQPDEVRQEACMETGSVRVGRIFKAVGRPFWRLLPTRIRGWLRPNLAGPDESGV